MKIDNFNPKTLQEEVTKLKQKSQSLKKQTSLWHKLKRFFKFI